MKCQYRSALLSGAPISKLTDILITNISAIIHTDTNADTDIAAPIVLLHFKHNISAFQYVHRIARLPACPG